MKTYKYDDGSEFPVVHPLMSLWINGINPKFEEEIRRIVDYTIGTRLFIRRGVAETYRPSNMLELKCVEGEHLPPIDNKLAEEIYNRIEIYLVDMP